jgi:phosphatidate cytidylyltransferase
MLKQRVLTAFVLFTILAGVLSFDSVWPFLTFLAFTCGVAGWEWTRLTLGRTSRYPMWLGVGLFLLTMAQAFAWLNLGSTSTLAVQVSTGLCVIFWLISVGTAIYRAQVQVPTASIAWSSFAVLTLFATWGVLAILYRTHGVTYVLSLLIVIWIADIAAYFVGRAMGRHKLAPSISPGKTREGALAGIVGVVIWMLVSAHWQGSFAADLMLRWGLMGTILLSVLLAVFSICGDLFESMLKRRAGVKDSSQLLPGHGGVYDRIDAVVAVVPLAYLLTEGLRF